MTLTVNSTTPKCRYQSVRFEEAELDTQPEIQCVFKWAFCPE